MDFIKNLLMAGIALFASEGQAATPLVINELMASNSRTITDLQGQYDDWIEIYNAGQAAINVGGKYLTDDLSAPTKWRIPNNNPSVTTIQPRGYLLIWADEDIADAGLHANFKLSTTGEDIGLFDIDGSTLIDSITFGEQAVDVSYGRYPDAGDTLQFMVAPTPGGTNRSGYLGLVSEPKFSQKRGFYTAPFSVTISTDTQSVTIYYTLDGSEPNAVAGLSPASMIYTNPIPINKTSCLRAIAVKPGWKSSEIVTFSYIFLNDVIKQPRFPTGFPTTWGSNRVDYEMDPDVVNASAYAPTIKEDLKTIPSVSIVINNNDFFGAQRGIYANAGGRGIDWERRASIEWIDPVEGVDFQVNAGLRIQGAVGRSSGVAKHSLRILFKNEYGPSRLEFPLFKDTEVESFESLILRAIWNYSWFGDSTACSGIGTAHADYLRDQFARDNIRDMGGLTPYGRPVHLYINGLYWGMYILAERPDDGFAALHLGGDKENYDVLKAPIDFGGSTMEVVAGDIDAWNNLFSLAATDLSSTKAYEAIQQYVDIPAMIDYLLMIYYVGSRDAPVLLCNNSVPRNFYAIRRREPAGPFLFIPWDVEWALESPTENRVKIVGVFNPHFLLDRLRSNSDFRILLADHIYRHFFNNGALTTEPSTRRYLDRANEVDRAIIGESARWGDSIRTNQPYTRVDWEAEVNRLVNEYFSIRTNVVLGQLRQAGFYPAVSAPEFLVNGSSQHGGHITSTDRLTMTASIGTIYYTLDGSDPRLPGTSSGTVSSTTLVADNAAKKVLVPTAAIGADWISNMRFNDNLWISGSGGVGYERSTGYESLIGIDVGAQMYNKLTSCYIRIPFTISGSPSGFNSLTLNMRYDDGFIAYINGTEVHRELFTGTPAWNSTTSTNHEVDGVESFNISDYLNTLHQGGNLLAIQGLNVSTGSSDFLISAELVAGQGSSSNSNSGISSSAIRYTSPITLTKSTHVKSRVLDGSTWSALNEATFAVGPVAQNLRITEIMYHPDESRDPNEEYIELKNIGTESINLNLVRFTDGIDFIFGDIVLAAGGYRVVVKDTGVFNTRYGITVSIAGQYSGSLSDGGERIRLEDAVGQTILDFEYKDDWLDITDGGGFSLTIIDAANPDPNSRSQKESWRALNPSPGR